jgi:hypothetical protein
MADKTSVLDEPALDNRGYHQGRASDARSAAGRPGRKISGFASVAMSGIPSTRAASAQPAFTSGLKLSASLAADGRRIRIGMRSEKNNAMRRLGFHRVREAVLESRPEQI